MLVSEPSRIILIVIIYIRNIGRIYIKGIWSDGIGVLLMSELIIIIAHFNDSDGWKFKKSKGFQGISRSFVA